MSTTKSPDESSHKKLANKVITPKRRYFFADSGKSVEAVDLVEANEIMNKEREESARLDKRKEGDGN